MSAGGRVSIYRGRLIELGLETAVLPNGATIELEIVRHPGGAVVLALDEADRVCLLRQYRHVVGDWIWELPAGVIEVGEDPLETAQRELREEAGLIAAQWRELGTMLPSPGFCSEELYLYQAGNLSHVGADIQPDEQIEVHWHTLEQVRAMAVDGRIRDAKTLVALYRFR
jgi:ADP-ribose pyrophosphatase